MELTLVAPLALLGFLGLAALQDLKTREIPNQLTLGGVVCGLTVSAIVGAAQAGLAGAAATLGSAGIAVVLGGAIALSLWYAGALGGGDVKLLAAAGSFVGPLFMLQMLALSLGCFSVMALVQFVREGRLKVALASSARFVLGRRSAGPLERLAARPLLPFGPAAFLGACATLAAGFSS